MDFKLGILLEQIDLVIDGETGHEFFDKMSKPNRESFANKMLIAIGKAVLEKMGPDTVLDIAREDIPKLVA